MTRTHSAPQHDSINVALNKAKNTYMRNIEKIKKDYATVNISEVKGDGQSENGYMQVALVEAEKLWFRLRCMLLSSGGEYQKLSDDVKMDLFKDDFDEFNVEFPIVSRWIICMGQYRRKAFEKYLKKCRNFVIDEAKRKADENYMRNQWIERQADYIKYLWIEYQRGKYSARDAGKVWRQAYESLHNEFKDFEDTHKRAEEIVKKEEVVHKTELLYELVDRINSSDQKLKNMKAQALYDLLLDKKYKQNHKATMHAILDTVRPIKPVLSAKGTNLRLSAVFEQERKQKDLKNKNSLI
jgi:hypothetical protein